jgi:hypothetical protein
MDVKAVMNNPQKSFGGMPNCKETRLVDFVDYAKTFPGFNQQLPAKCLVFLLLFGAERYKSLEITLANVGYLYLKVHLFYIEFCNDAAFR